MMKVTFLDHSGFLVEVQDAYFLFDYYKGKLPQLDVAKKLYVFVSHSHYDHFRKDLFELKFDSQNIYYIISSDIVVTKCECQDLIQMDPDEQKEVQGAKIRTLRSTDEGVAFLVEYKGKTIYHAGDLNWWHWEGEPEEYNLEMKHAYQTEINKLAGEQIDLAFIPVDPRLGEQYCWGLDYFMKHTETKVVFPMHFWEDYTIFDRLNQEACVQDYAERIMRMERSGQSFVLD